jgi:hypothetical protein
VRGRTVVMNSMLVFQIASRAAFVRHPGQRSAPPALDSNGEKAHPGRRFTRCRSGVAQQLQGQHPAGWPARPDVIGPADPHTREAGTAAWRVPFRTPSSWPEPGLEAGVEDRSADSMSGGGRWRRLVVRWRLGSTRPQRVPRLAANVGHTSVLLFLALWWIQMISKSQQRRTYENSSRDGFKGFSNSLSTGLTQGRRQDATCLPPGRAAGRPPRSTDLSAAPASGLVRTHSARSLPFSSRYPLASSQPLGPAFRVPPSAFYLLACAADELYPAPSRPRRLVAGGQRHP